jgi:hypothetical protein
MASRSQSRTRSDASPVRFLSDSYFKAKHSRQRSLSLTKPAHTRTVSPKPPTPKQNSLHPYVKPIIDELPSMSKLRRNEENQILSILFLLIGLKSHEKHQPNNVSAKIAAKLNEFSANFENLTQTKNKNFISKVNQAETLHSSIKPILYGYPLIKCIVKLIEFIFDHMNIQYKAFRFIDYFDVNLSPNEKTRTSNRTKSRESGTADHQYETTKETEFMHTTGDEHDFDKNLDIENRLSLHTEPDNYRDRLLQSYFTNRNSQNPYMSKIVVNSAYSKERKEKGEVEENFRGMRNNFRRGEESKLEISEPIFGGRDYKSERVYSTERLKRKLRYVENFDTK